MTGLQAVERRCSIEWAYKNAGIVKKRKFFIDIVK
jgi:hypothetical protein